MFLLERHPAVLADVLDEIDGVLGGRSMTAADIARMPLLDRVVKESMRLLPPLPMLFLRVPASEVSLGRYTLPKGANVVVSPYVTHRDPELYPEPLRFRPERWAEIKPTTYEYLPFGAGPRICLGAAFAQQALRLLLPTLLQRVRVVIQHNTNITRIVRSSVLRPKHGIRAQLQPPHRRRLVPEPIRGNIHEMVELR
jgi:cytochrome P450